MPISDHVEVIAHRGASAHAPENTLESFALARRLGADCLEFDVRATSDGVPIVLHDPTLERTTGIPREITAITAAELAALPGPCRPPTLDDVLDAFGTTTDYLIEIKRIPVSAEDVVLGALRRRGLERNATIQSFDHVLLRRLRRRNHRVRLAALFRPGADVVSTLDLVASYVDGIGPVAAQVDSALTERAHARRLAVRPWTVNDSGEMRRLVAAGVDGIITDRPERARVVIGRSERAAARAATAAHTAPPGAQARMAATSPA